MELGVGVVVVETGRTVDHREQAHVDGGSAGGQVQTHACGCQFSDLARLCEPGVVPTHRKYPLTPEPAVQLKVVDAEVRALLLAGLVMVAAATVYSV